MPPSFYQIRQCQNPACGLRYPLTEGHPFGERCPLCLGATRVELERPLSQEPFPAALLPSPFQREGPGVKVEALLDNVRSAWNVGSMFRTAEGFGLRQLHLCGITPTPENTSVAKTALGADTIIPWTHAKNALTAAQKLKAAGCQLWALEQDERAIPISDLVIDDLPIALIVGNEITGVDPALLDLCDKIVYLPMRGQKRSFNVAVAFGICVSQLVDKNY